MRKETRKIQVGNIFIGGDSPVTVQSMTNTDTRDAKATIRQIDELVEAGCDIVRVAIPDMEAADAFADIKKSCRIPLVADIHFDHRLALACIRNGADKIRINPGNIGSAEHVAKVAEAAEERRIPIRIGVNSGSVEKDILAAYPSINGKISAKALVASASRHVAMLEDLDFGNIVLSLKSSDVETTVEAYRLMSAQSVYPLHLGVTEAGTLYHGIIKSSAGIGCLLLEGIGDTIRVSLTAPPVEEIRAGIALLRAVGIRNDGVEIISCPTCGRTGIDVAKIADELEAALASRTGHLKIAVMGCVVNGPGEAKECDIGVAAAGTGNEGMAVLFKKGRILRRIKEDEIVREILKEIDHGVQNI